MPSDLLLAYRSAVEDAALAKGKREMVRIFGKDIDALFYEWGEDLMPVSGGEGDTGTYKIWVAEEDLPAHALESGVDYSARNITRSFLSCDHRGPCVEIILGDISAQIKESD